MRKFLYLIFVTLLVICIVFIEFNFESVMFDSNESSSFLIIFGANKNTLYTLLYIGSILGYGIMLYFSCKEKSSNPTVKKDDINIEKIYYGVSFVAISIIGINVLLIKGEKFDYFTVIILMFLISFTIAIIIIIHQFLNDLFR